QLAGAAGGRARARAHEGRDGEDGLEPRRGDPPGAGRRPRRSHRVRAGGGRDIRRPPLHVQHVGRPGGDHPRDRVGRRRRGGRGEDRAGARAAVPAGVRRLVVAQLHRLPAAGHPGPLDHDLGGHRPLDHHGGLAPARDPAAAEADPDPVGGVLRRPHHGLTRRRHAAAGRPARLRPGRVRHPHLLDRLGGDPGRAGRLPLLPRDGLRDRLGRLEPRDRRRGLERDHEPDDVPLRHVLPRGVDARVRAGDRPPPAALLHGERAPRHDREGALDHACNSGHRGTVARDRNPLGYRAAVVPVGAFDLAWVRGTEVRYEHVIVGGGLAGGMVAQEFREQGGDGSVLIVAREAHTPYHRPPLTKGYLRGEAGPDEVFMHPDEWWKEQAVDVRTGTEATAVDTPAHTVTLAGGDTVEYGKLVLATGATPRTLPGTVAIRTVDDSDSLAKKLDAG